MAEEPCKPPVKAGFHGYQPIKTTTISTLDLVKVKWRPTSQTTRIFQKLKLVKLKNLVSKTGIKFGPYSWFVLTIILGSLGRASESSTNGRDQYLRITMVICDWVSKQIMPCSKCRRPTQIWRKTFYYWLVSCILFRYLFLDFSMVTLRHLSKE